MIRLRYQRLMSSVLTCFVWFLVHTRPAVPEIAEDEDDYELGEMGSAQE